MKQFPKKLISLLLVISVVFGTVSAAAVTSLAAPAKTVAATAKSENAQVEEALGNSVNPVIVVPGIGMSDVALFDSQGNQIKNDGTFKDRWRVLNLCTDDIMNDIWKLVPRALLSIALQKDVGLSDIITQYMPGMFKYATHDLEGNSVENVKAIEHNYPLSQYSEEDKNDFFNMMPMQKYVSSIGESKIYCFNFPAFSNTYTEAARLNKFVKMVKQQTGCDKVNLVPLSLGATITNAYFDEYADSHDVGKVVYVVGATNGSLVFADLVSANYSVNSAKLFYSDIAPQLVDGYQGYLINILLRILPKKVLNNVLDAAFEVVRKDFFVNTPSMWSIVPAEKYTELSNKYLSDSAHVKVKALTDKYYSYQSHLEENVKALVADGVEIYNLCGYGFNFGHGWGDYQYFQFFKCADDVNSDGVIQISSTSMGAYSCAPNTTFPAGYVQKNTHCTNTAHNHISPDRMIDASACYLPESTWFFAGQHHEIAGNDVAVALACTILSTDTIKNVYSDPRFPQFNGSRNVKKITRDYLPKATDALARTDLTATDKAELQAAVDAATAMLASTVANDAQCDAIEARLFNILVKIGVYAAPGEVKASDAALEKTLKFISDKLWEKYGAKGYSEIIKSKSPLAGLTGLLAKLAG